MEKGLILFVHGLGGKSIETWENFPRLIENEPGFEIYDLGFFEYPTSLFRIPFSKKSPRIQTLADALRTTIQNRYPNHRPIAIIAHSLGGLIARQYIMEELIRNKPLRVQKLLLFAVPVNGSGLANIGMHLSWRNQQLKQLCINSDLVDNINRTWFNYQISKKIQVKYVVAAIDRVVDESSARGFLENIDVEVLADCGHINCVKPDSNNHLSFLILKNFILNSYNFPETSNYVLPEVNAIRNAENKPIIDFRVSIEAARIEDTYLRILFTVWNTGTEIVRILSFNLIEIIYKPKLSFLTGDRTPLEIREGEKSTLWQNKVTILNHNESESFDLKYYITNKTSGSKPTLVLGMQAIYTSKDITNDTMVSEEIIVYKSSEDTIEVLNGETLLKRIEAYPFDSEHVMVTFKYLDYLREKGIKFLLSISNLYRSTIENIIKKSNSEFKLEDAKRASSLWESISYCIEDYYRPSSPKEYLFTSLSELCSLHLKYFNRFKSHEDNVLKVILSDWDPLGIKDNYSRYTEYDTLVRHIFRLFFKCGRDKDKFMGELKKYIQGIDIGEAINSLEDISLLLEKIDHIRLQYIEHENNLDYLELL